MTSETPATDTGRPVSARVLSGRLAGAALALAPGRRLSVGPDFLHDLVLRDAGADGAAAEVEAGADGAVRITAVAGRVTLLGMPLAHGQTVQVPPFVPVRLGSAALAFGTADEGRWAEASALAAGEPPATDPTASGPAPAWRARLTRAGGRLRTRGSAALQSGFVLAAALAVIGLASATAVADGIAGGIAGLVRPGPAEAEERLHEAGFPAVDLQESGGRTIATGLVDDEDARQEVKRLLDRSGVHALIDIRTGPELARAAADVARMHGVAASASWQTGTLELHTVPLERQQQAALVEAVRRDVRGVGPVRLVGDLEAGDDGAAIARVSDATKRVATVVVGDPGYVQTVDGARYFIGAVMPSGHVLRAIEAGAVVLERDGKSIRVAF
jgi:type III secretion protein D